MAELIVIGGGLAGSEAAWQAAKMGIQVTLFEMRPKTQTGAHTTENMAELVCSNSFGSNLLDRASGLLKGELKKFNSLLIEAAENSSVPAGSALAVDRNVFSETITSKIESHPLITVERAEITSIPQQTTIIASGPLTSDSLANSIKELTGGSSLYFYDALSPIIEADSINLDIAFFGSRYNKGILPEGDYLNCPLGKEQYDQFVYALLKADEIPLRSFESSISEGVQAGHPSYFEACMPVEEMARRGENSLAFGPMRPIGIYDPKTNRRPYAVLQLRRDDLAGNLYNMVGFQTNLKFTEQDRVFRLVPGLENAEFIRYGQMHRNTYISSPQHLLPTLQYNQRNNLFFAGQITGVEGYAGSIATGLLAGLNSARYIKGLEPIQLPKTTMIGALLHYITTSEAKQFQPMKANFGLFPVLERKVKGKRARGLAHAQRALADLDLFIANMSS
jgi:methylenetetrahydrofolate--tRNA-(uracil-5-)-methyltransferase